MVKLDRAISIVDKNILCHARTIIGANLIFYRKSLYSGEIIKEIYYPVNQGEYSLTWYQLTDEEVQRMILPRII